VDAVTLPMFPLGSVLFPSLALPLHVFEPRYRQLVADCLAAASGDDSEAEFGVVLIERGLEVGGGDVRSDVGTVARMVEVAEFDDGRYAVTSVGVRRVRILRWLDDDPYPRAEVEGFEDTAIGIPLDDDYAAVRHQLSRAWALRAELGEASVDVSSVGLSDDPILGSYQAAAVAPVGPFDHHRLLAVPGADGRLALLAGLLRDEIELLELRMAAEAGPLDDEP
jgi:uncharacterized protein